MIHVMVDLETMGTVPGCSILSIGAVVFHPEQRVLGDEFYTVIDEESCRDALLRIEPSTAKWWSGQSVTAQQVVAAARSGKAERLSDALSRFNGWLAMQGAKADIRLYSNGADFDNPILRVAYDCVGLPLYAGSYGGRCYRTLKNLHELFGDDFAAPKLARSGIHHNALDDAKSQATHLMETIATIRSKLKENLQ